MRLGLPPRAAATIRAAVGAPPPEEYFCSISCELMVDPCFAADGHSYERANITAWLATIDVAAHERGAAAQDGRAEPRAEGVDLGVQGPLTGGAVVLIYLVPDSCGRFFRSPRRCGFQAPYHRGL